MRPIEQTQFAVYSQNINHHSFFNKLVDERAYFEVYPDAIDYEMLEPTKRQIAGYAKGNIIGKDGTLMRAFEKNARVVNTTARTVQWRLYTNEGDLRGTFIKNLEENNANPGLGNSVFEIGLSVEWFGPNDVIIFEGAREIPLLVRSHPHKRGQAFVYEVVLLDGNRNSYFEPEWLEIGTRVIQIGSLIGESTVERGNIHFGEGEAFVEFEVPMTRMGWQMKVTDDAWYAATHFKVQEKDSNNNVKQGAVPFMYNTLDAKFENAVNTQIDLWLTYGRSAGRFAGRYLDGLTERDLKAGPGLFEFLESSYIYDYNPEGSNIDIFREFLPTLWNDKVDPNDRVVDVWTGTGGMLLWEKWCKAADIEPIMHTEGMNYSKETPWFDGRSGVGIGAKDYIAFHIKPWGKVRVNYMPFLDSELVESRKYKGLPYTSYQFIIFNYGYGDGRNSNIYLLNNQNYKQFGYETGTWTPLGPKHQINSNIASRFSGGNGMENAYFYIYEAMVGMIVKDPSYLVWYRPNFA